MEAIKKIVNGAMISDFFNLPESFKTKQLEVIIIPVEDSAIITTGELKRGALSAYQDPAISEKEKQAWEMAVHEKYDNN